MRVLLSSLALAGCMLAQAANAHQDPIANAKIERQSLGNNLYMLTGFGGNVGVSAGDDGILIIDDQFEPLATKIAANLKDISDKSVNFIVNTHFHGDHTGGNAWFAKEHDATVFAHHKVRTRMQKNPKNTPAHLPVVTFEQGIQFHYNDERIRVMHLPNGHTDGDSVVWFEHANVLHMGDLFFNKMFPFIDVDGGGSVAGFIANIKLLLGKVKDDTRIIPGHGDLASKADLQRYLQMLEQTSQQVRTWKKRGKTLEDVLALGVDEKWKSWSWNFIPEERWLTTLYNGL